MEGPKDAVDDDEYDDVDEPCDEPVAYRTGC